MVLEKKIPNDKCEACGSESLKISRNVAWVMTKLLTVTVNGIRNHGQISLEYRHRGTFGLAKM